ncbi:type I-MYXAN CRISPR-associated protein Cmx8 [Polyangium mundeleinium]|uniref:Type I-MYXAN CRISPR-associated protein Cmx8 n=1 Tax=Polyangium mundeleinium TaxID=2995306 RepID=A0ABT5EFB4_9BACT|nr:type I-MYXAN CRISPR-associated protein Cmx8 [Polyangium mundeleinium]MDC0739938.1 type I-MYXAN CRISPR-associated protein Cmx8 [Polyangium mundeleinium]
MTETTNAKASRGKAAKKDEAPSVLALEWSLAELPSAQHRAGLAGLVLMVRWLEGQPGGFAGTCRITRIDEAGLSLLIDLAGLGSLLDATYEAASEEEEYPSPWKNKAPIREVQKEEVDKKGKVKTKTYYVYPRIVPSGAWLVSYDPSGNGSKGGEWTALFRRMLWETFRGVPATRAPFEERAAKRACGLAEDTWKDLCRPPEHAVRLPSTYYLGAQANSADGVPFFDRARYQFLLHFWPFVASIYVPAHVKPQDGKREYVPYAIVVPDVAALASFCEELPYVLKARETRAIGKSLPEAAVLDLAIEGALDTARRLRERIAAREGRKDTADLVLGYEVHHVTKEGNNVRVLSSSRVEPDADTVDHYARNRKAFRHPPFRQVWLSNLIHGRPRHVAFDRLIATSPLSTMTFGSNAFRHDARKYFEITSNEAAEMQEENETPENTRDDSIEAIVYAVVSGYVRGKLKAKYNLAWEDVKAGKKSKKDYEEKKEKVAKEAFLAVRARPEQDFVSYFAGTLCSVPQFLDTKRYSRLTHALQGDTGKVRTLTLLALSANAWSIPAKES